MSYNYSVIQTQYPLSASDLYEGRVVCLNGVHNNPNLSGVLEDAKKVQGARGTWTAMINGTRYCFNNVGVIISPSGQGTSPALYGVLSDGEIDPTIHNAQARPMVGYEESDTVSISYMIPKDYFACHALNALINKLDNPLSMNDGTIALLASKAYKIAAAMAIEAYNSRENDPASSSSGDYVNIDSSNLQTNTDRVLYNISEALRTGIKITNIDEVDFDGTPNIRISNSANDPVNIKDVDNIQP